MLQYAVGIATFLLRQPVDITSMTRENPILRAQAIVKVLRNYPEGASLEQISSDMNPPPPNRRALQRWLLELIEQGRVIRTGKARACRYTLAANPEKGKHWAYASEAEYIVPPKAERPFLGMPPHMAKGPNTTPMTASIAALLRLLDAYNPNTSAYLDDRHIERLYALGQRQVDLPLPEACTMDLCWNSCRLEGNSYTMTETEALLGSGQWASSRSNWETQMMLNHWSAIDFLIEPDCGSKHDDYTLLNLHALLADNLGPSKQRAMDDLLAQFLFKAAQIADPFEQSFFTWMHLSHLQAFDAMNNPLARLMANLPLLKNKLWPLTFVEVSHAHYEEALLNVHQPFQLAALREFFVWAYTRSCKRYSAILHMRGKPDAFKLEHRQAISTVVFKVVREQMTFSQSAPFAREFASHSLPAQDQARFSEVVLQELADLDEWNIARFKISKRDLSNWKHANLPSVCE